jgi:hypothetical protein
MNSTISLLIVEKEIQEAREYGEALGWQFAYHDTGAQLFTVLLTSPIDQQVYRIDFQYDSYPQIPYLIEFVHPNTMVKGSKNCYPKGKDSFFHPNGAICHPCSRKAYSGFSNLHSEWNMTGWQQIAGAMISLRYILDGIYTRISETSLYEGRMV